MVIARLRYVTALLVLAALFVSLTAPAISDAAVRVRGYYRQDGTYVQPHYRSNPDGNPYNNWSYPGNTNPYTGETATGNPDTYLKNYYGTTNYSSNDSYFPSSAPSSYSAATYASVVGGYYVGSTLFCSYGYYKVGSSCTQAPVNAYAYGGDNFYCYSGYENINGACVSKTSSSYCESKYGSNTEYSYASGECVCKAHYANLSGQCVAALQYCQATYGSNSYYNGTGSCAFYSQNTSNTSQSAAAVAAQTDDRIYYPLKSYIKNLVDYENINCRTFGFVKSEDTTSCEYYKSNKTNSRIKWSVFFPK